MTASLDDDEEGGFDGDDVGLDDDELDEWTVSEAGEFETGISDDCDVILLRFEVQIEEKTE